MTYKGFDKYLPVKEKLKQMEEVLIKMNNKLEKRKNFKNETK
jgi:hypothetical protein